MADRTETFESVFLGGKTPGTLKMNSAGLAWKASGGSGKTVSYRREELRTVAIVRSLLGYQLRLVLTNGAHLKLDGFTRESVVALRKFMKDTYEKTIEEREHSLKGISWGDLDIKDSILVLSASGKPVLEVPLAGVSNAIILPSRTDVALELDTDGDNTNDVAVAEIQFHVPNNSKIGSTTKDHDTTSAEVLHRLVKAATGRGRETQTPIASFKDLNCSHPSGRFSIDLFEKQFWVSSAANDYKLQYDNIQRIFLLPKDADKIIVVLALNTNIRQGQTQYNYLIFNFDEGDELALAPALSEDEIASKFAGKLKQQYDAAAYSVFTQVLAGVSGKSITTVGDNPFVNDHDQKYVQCTVKTNRGFLYPLRKAFLFVSKVPLYVGYNQIHKIEFSGMEPTSTTFDMKVVVVNDSSEDGDRTIYNFLQINRQSLNALKEFCVAKDLRIKQITPMTPAKVIPTKEALEDDGDEEDEDSPDEDFAPNEDSDVDEEYEKSDEEHSAPAPKTKPKEAAEVPAHTRKESSNKKRSRDDDEDKEEDDDDADESDDEMDKDVKPKKPKGSSSASASSASKSTKGASKRQKKDKDAPKKAMASFMFFNLEKRASMPKDKSKTFGEIGKEIGEMWKSLSKEDRAPYEAKAEADKKRYAREMEAYKAKKANED